MNKRELVQQIISKLKEDVAMFAKSAQATHEQATDAENRAEDKYDTRGLEASYLAMGQARQAEETAIAVQAFEALTLRDFMPMDEISLGALVTVESRNRPSHYLVGPKAGGTELNHEGKEVMVITPQSPLGRQLMGRRQGDTFEMEIGGRKSASRIAKVA